MNKAKNKKSLIIILLLIFAICPVIIAINSMSLHSATTFGLTENTDFYTIDTGAGLVFKIRRTDNGVSTQSAGDIASLVYNGVEYQNQSRGSQINSGFDYLYKDVSSVKVSAEVINTDYIKVTIEAGNLTHYYMAKNGSSNVYMGTYFTTEPDVVTLCRYILRLKSSLLPNGPEESDIRNTVSTVESGDVFALSNGQTRSKHYSNMRLMDWSYIGATGNNVGAWMVRDNNEGASGGPFYRCLLNQCTTTDQEITYIVNYGEGQTEAFRTSILNNYTLVFNNGSKPNATIDTSWFDGMGLKGYVDSKDRGKVSGVGIKGIDSKYEYTVGFANEKAQYYTIANSSSGYFSSDNMIPGTYNMTIYKNELSVWTGKVTVTAGNTEALNTITITDDPSFKNAVWRIGDWDGTPLGFLNADKITKMHPSDVRMSSWSPVTYTVGKSEDSSFPCYQWKDVNGSQIVKFNLNSDQLVSSTIRIGITCAYSGARPKITLNSWTSGNPAISTQPKTRTLTVGTYRGNNITYPFDIPASALIEGENTLTIMPISGSGGAAFLSAGYSVDCVDFIQSNVIPTTPPVTTPPVTTPPVTTPPVTTPPVTTPPVTTPPTTAPTDTPIEIKGDANGDSKVTSTDVSLVERYLLGIITANDLKLKLVDMNDDGKITSTDVSKIERYILG